MGTKNHFRVGCEKEEKEEQRQTGGSEGGGPVAKVVRIGDVRNGGGPAGVHGSVTEGFCKPNGCQKALFICRIFGQGRRGKSSEEREEIKVKSKIKISKRGTN